MPEKKGIDLLSVNQIFPDQVKVFPVKTAGKSSVGKVSHLRTHIGNPFLKEDNNLFTNEIAAYLKDKETGTVYSFFFRHIKKESANITWQLSSCRLNKDEKGQPIELVVFTYDLDLLADVKKRLYTVLESDRFFKENFEKTAKLTKREREIIGLLSQGMSNNEIAAFSYTSIHTVHKHRQHITEKLGTQSFYDLLQFAEVFDLTNKENNT